MDICVGNRGGGGGGGYTSLRDAKVDRLMTQTSTIPVTVCSAERPGLAAVGGGGGRGIPWGFGEGGGGGGGMHTCIQTGMHSLAGRQAGFHSLTYLFACWLT